MNRRSENLLVGILSLVIGVLLVIGEINIPYLGTILALCLLIWGALVIWGNARGDRNHGIIAFVIGLVLILSDNTGILGGLLELIVGILLILYGAARLMNRL